MRPILILLFGGIMLASAQTSSPPTKKADQFYNQGVTFEKSGDLESAKIAYLQALKINPRHADAEYRLGELKRDRGDIAKKAREAKFGAVVIPQIALDAVTVPEALEALRVSMEKASNGETTANFVIKDPDQKFAKSSISFQLKSVPAKGILEYILSQGSAKATYDEYAVVIEPRP